MKTIRKAKPFDYVLLVILAGFLSSSFFLIKIALNYMPLFFVVYFRLLIAFIFLLVLVKIKKLSFPRKKSFWINVFILGILGNIAPFYLITWAEQTISSALAALYMSSIPIFALFLAHFLSHDEKINIKKILGLCISFVGLIILLHKDLTSLSFGLFAQLACLLAALFFAYSRVKAKEISEEEPLVTSAATLLTSLIILSFYLPFGAYKTSDFILSYEGIFSIVLLGLVPTAIAFVILYKLINNVGAVFMLSVNYLVPIFGLFWGYALLGEQIAHKLVLPLFLIILGIFFASK